MNRFAVFLIPLAIIVVWALVSACEIADPLFLPSPWQVGRSLWAGLVSGGLGVDLAVTIARSFAGFALAAMIGIPLGLLIGRNPALARATQPTIDFFRSIPATALFPLFLFFFGIGDAAKIAVVIYACALIVLVNTSYGAMQVKAPRILAATVMGANQWHVFWKIVIPESAPGIFAGLRLALSLSFVLVIVTEMFIGTRIGLGYQIVNSQLTYRIPDVYAGITLAGLAGYVSNLAILRVESRMLHWVGK